MPSFFDIVQVNVSVREAPAPNLLQQTGAFVSQGGTTNAKQSLTLVPTLAALQDMLSPAIALTSLTWSGGTVTGTTSSPHGWTVSDVIPVIVAGATPSGYNGSFTGTITGASTFTYPLVNNPGSETVPGTVMLEAVNELLGMGTTYFAQNGVVAPYVLELGEGIVNTNVTNLSTWLTNNPLTVYAFLMPRNWHSASTFVTLASQFTAPNKLTYFWQTIQTGDVTGSPPVSPFAALKSVLTEVEAATVNAALGNEFSLAALFAFALSRQPSSASPLGPLSYAPLFGVTPYPLMGNQALFLTLAEANVGWVGTGQQGGISGNIAFQGQMQDGNPWNFWYGTDWAQLQINLALANEVINGSQPSSNPLLYDQNGINRLQNRAAQVLNQAVSSGIANGRVVLTKLAQQDFLDNLDDGAYDGLLVLNAEPYTNYIAENPSNYEAGIYGGLTCVFIPARGFLQIIFGLNVDFTGV